MNCRHCGTLIEGNLFADLDHAPPSNAYLSDTDLTKQENYYPLKVMVCDNCWLVQTQDFNLPDELFTDDYAYFSSTSSTFLTHAKNYAEMITKRLSLDSTSFVMELASNDGYLLKNFVQNQIPCLGIEPTKSTADESIANNIPTLIEFFGQSFASNLMKEHPKADLIIGNNVYAHVPDINDFTSGIQTCLSDEGTVTLEFPHLANLIKFFQFDTIYHEHYSYLSLGAVSKIFSHHDLRVYDVERLSTHGGSLRVYGCHKNSSIQQTPNVEQLLEYENDLGLFKLETYSNFQSTINDIKYNTIKFFIDNNKNGLVIDGYGAAAKGNTLLNFAGIKKGLIRRVYDGALAKQNKFLPGSHIPIVHPKNLMTDLPDAIVIFPWNIADEIVEQYKELKNSGVKFYSMIPEIKEL
jgi:hypothetical protein